LADFSELFVKQHLTIGGKLSNVELVFPPMILEVAILEVKPDLTEEFEAAFFVASTIIASMQGYINHELQRCLEVNNRYILLVRWQQLEDHTVGFRQSPKYQEWRSLLHHIRWFTDGERRYGTALWKQASVRLNPGEYHPDYGRRKAWREGLEVAMKIKS